MTKGLAVARGYREELLLPILERRARRYQLGAGVESNSSKDRNGAGRDGEVSIGGACRDKDSSRRPNEIGVAAHSTGRYTSPAGRIPGNLPVN